MSQCETETSQVFFLVSIRKDIRTPFEIEEQAVVLYWVSCIFKYSFLVTIIINIIIIITVKLLLLKF